MENRNKLKLKRRGENIYYRYFFNPIAILEYVINCVDKQIPIDEDKCSVVFDLPYETYKDKIYELILFYPRKLKESKIITEKFVNDIYNEYGETINIMKEKRKYGKHSNVRGKICANAQANAKKRGVDFKLTSEDIKLPKICPYLSVEIIYDSTGLNIYSASIDRVDNTRGYIKDNIEIISYQANMMKSSASIPELITFSKNILKLYDTP